MAAAMPDPRRRQSCSARLLLLLSLAFLPTFTAARPTPPSSSGYVTVFDAGSTGTRAHVYRYTRDGVHALPRLESLGQTAKAGPLSAVTPGQVAGLLQPLIDHALSVIPPDAARSTDAVFLATAGLRALEPRVASALVDAAAAALKKGSPFIVRPGGAAVLAGADEAALAWTAANAATGALGGGSGSGAAVPSTGIVELGGASLQVAFEVGSGAVHHHPPLPADTASVGTLALSTAAPPGGRRPRRGGGGLQPVTLYARSFEGLGHEAAAAAAGVVGGGDGGDRPCLPPVAGAAATTTTTEGGDDSAPFARCKAAAATALASACGHGPAAAAHCPLPSHKSARARPPPRLAGVRLLGLENLAHTAAFLGVAGADATAAKHPATLADLASAGARLCAHGAAAAAPPAHASAPLSEAARHCFGSAFAVTLLHGAFGIPLEADTLDFGGTVVTVGGGGASSPPSVVAPDWAQGAALVAALGGSGGAGGHPFAGGVLTPHGGGGGGAGAGHPHRRRLEKVVFLFAAGAGLAAASGAAWPGALGAKAARAARRVRRGVVTSSSTGSLLRAPLARRLGGGGGGSVPGSRADLLAGMG